MGATARRRVALGAAVGAIAMTNAHAQLGPNPSAVLNPYGQATRAADSGNGSGLSIVPSVSITETLTDNSQLASNFKQWDLVSQITPGIHVESRGARVKGFFDYTLTGIAYARHSGSNEFQNTLNSLVNLEAVENRAFIDFTGDISQQSISAYGTRTADNSLINGNRSEVRTLGVSPYFKGRLFGLADYEARWTQNWSRNSTTTSANYDSSLASLRVNGDTGPRLLNWSADASHLAYSYDVGRRTVDDIIRGTLYITPDPQLRLSLIAGRESTNIGSIETQTNNTPGFGVDWSPSERSQLSGQIEKRFFGNYHSLSFTHRTPRTVWKFSDTQDVTAGFGQPVAGNQGTAFDLLFTQFASIQPDPAQRAALVNAFLQANGISPTAQLFSGSLASAPLRQRRQELSFGLLGVRDTITFAASQTQGANLDTTLTIPDDFANGNVVKTRGFSVAASHRLTPTAALNVVGSMDRTSGSTTAQSSTLRSISVYWLDRFGPHGTISLSAHHSSYSSPTQPYEETGISAAVG